MRKSGFMPLVMIAVLVLFLVVAVAFSGLMFGNLESEVNTTSLDNETLAQYENSTAMVQAGITVLDVGMWILVAGLLVFGAIFLFKCII